MDDDQDDFPSLGGPSGGPAGPKPAGAWGKGLGQLAGQSPALLGCSVIDCWQHRDLPCLPLCICNA